MAEFKKINDTQVELHATPEEWDAIKTLLAYAADNYIDLELNYNISDREKQFFLDLKDYFIENPPPSAIFYIDDASRMRLTVSITIYDYKKLFRSDPYMKILNELEKFDFHREFNIPKPKVIDNLEDFREHLENLRSGNK